MIRLPRPVGALAMAAALLAAGAGETMAQTKAPGTNGERASLNADELPAGPQETTASLGKTAEARIHQWGIIRADKTQGNGASESAALLSVPKFVHRKMTQLTSPAAAWLDYSALYVHPPMMLKAPLNFDITMSTPGEMRAWYPYAAASHGNVAWRGVLAGAQADGLMTTHPVWMGARAVASPATLKIYRPGPPGTKPDDPGTTEGDVFLFARAALSLTPIDVSGNDTSVTIALADTKTTAPPHGWIVSVEPPGDSGDTEFRVRNLSSTPQVERPAKRGRLWHYPLVLASNLPQPLSAAQMRARFNEAFTGNGLDPDEAGALTSTLLAALQQAPGTYAVVLLPADLVEQTAALKITGSPAAPAVRVFVAIGRVEKP